ncbi:MAG: sugar phosphate isomerase/epimerase [Anaerolineae bacterium]|jgi:sugar phosphate isomerase/epimerase|nr:sugar phosphate isomerase/epimerase [Anaerolineae bacterium]
MKLSLVLSTHQAQFEAVALKGDFEANIAKIAAWGYDGVELAIRDPALVEVGTLMRVVEDHGLAVPAIGTGQAWGEERLSFTSDDARVRAAAVARIVSHIPLAAQMHAAVIIGLIRGITPQGQGHEDSMAYFAEAMRACGEAAQGTGVRFAIEPLNRYETDLIHTVAEGLAFLDRVGMGNVGLLLDTFHMNIEEPHIEESVRACGDRIFHVHVADSNRWYPGAGHLDFAGVVATLLDTGYEGWISGEFMPRPDADTAAGEAIKTMRMLL